VTTTTRLLLATAVDNEERVRRIEESEVIASRSKVTVIM
jgi:hypothetical protein